ncbi:MAG TPA: alpha/beta hydrolase [Dehalococcoidia bacterium]|nr:alpha/beta hydrolase [Dehalococcoidia bacterium]
MPEPLTVPEERISVAGIKLQLFKAGQGPNLLVLHDCEVMTTWHPFHEALASRFTVLAPSHPGFGASERPDNFETIEDIAYLYLELMKTAAGGRAHVLGLGVGGWIAAEMAIRCSHNMERLVLADSVGIKVGGTTDVDILDTFILTREQLLDSAWADPSLGAQRMKLPGEPDLAYEELVTLLSNREAAARYCWKPFMHNPSLRYWLRRIDVPTLVLWGEEDKVVRPDYGRAFQKAIPHSQFKTIAKAGHYPYLEQPDEFVATVSAFLAGD